MNLYKNSLISYSLRLCSWICGMAISSDSPWVKMLVLHLVFFIRLLMYLAIVSLEQVDKLTARRLLKHYISGTRTVLSEYILSFLHSPEAIERHIHSLEAEPVNRKDQYLRKNSLRSSLSKK
ncbi:hypothetical protein MSBR3_0784 [Methanosarcina barkeri 3]|uniref:Uncharacterized protein n=1 Tax=Methanosarcina barkeri 3 TaxID=1434107 RepID=A0A0E3SKC5_METBA|nr:hypothetical protein [Methanosarcina barkeri]AKB81362.1 hypothetical protein MSBR3_0784 [Methanosarcina barkeri 3]